MAVAAERGKEATPHEDLMAGNLGRVLPVRISDFDRAAGAAERPPLERPAEHLETRRERPPVERLPEELPEAPRERRGEGRPPPVERLPEDILQKRARPKAEEIDVALEEAKPAEEPKKRGGKGGEFNPFE